MTSIDDHIPSEAHLCPCSKGHAINSKEFASFIWTQKLAEDEILVSFDVVIVYLCAGRSSSKGGTAKTVQR